MWQVMFNLKFFFSKARVFFNFEYSKNQWFFREYLFNNKQFTFIFANATLFDA